MKDNELRAMFADLTRKINERIVGLDADQRGGAPISELVEQEQANRSALQRAENETVRARLDRINEFVTVANNKDVERDQLLDVMRARLDRIQELCEQGRRFGDVPPPFQLPSPRIPFIAGMAIGALIFAFGVLAGSFLK